MLVKIVKIGEITPYENNPRVNINAVEPVAQSIKQFGFQQPIIVDKNNIIIVGHTRYKAAQLLELDEIPIVVADNLTDEQAKAYRLADNKTHELSTWDIDKLRNEVNTILETNLDVFGFDIDNLLDCISDHEALDLHEPTDSEIADNSQQQTSQCPKCGFKYFI
jgi:site-specific DNA-methyltransferase (adenine-specific)